MIRHRITNADLENKVGDCSVCGEGIPLIVKSKPQKGKNHLQRYCKKAVRDREKEIRKDRERLYGITLSEIQTMIDNQNGLCKICQTEPATDVDHCHSTGKVRGILCHYCNTGLGLFRDNLDHLESAKRYLTESRQADTL